MSRPPATSARHWQSPAITWQHCSANAPRLSAGGRYSLAVHVAPCIVFGTDALAAARRGHAIAHDLRARPMFLAGPSAVSRGCLIVCPPARRSVRVRAGPAGPAEAAGMSAGFRQATLTSGHGCTERAFRCAICQDLEPENGVHNGGNLRLAQVEWR